MGKEEKILELMNKIQEQKEKLHDLEKDKKEIQKEIDNFDVSDYIDEDEFAEYLNINNDDVYVLGHWLGEAGNILKKIDYLAFREEYNNYIDSLEKDTIKEYNDLEDTLERINDEIEELEDEIEILENELSVLDSNE